MGAKPACSYSNRMKDLTEDKYKQRNQEQLLFDILQEIEKSPHTSQHILADKLGVASGLINLTIKRIIAKGFVKLKKINSRNSLYMLTPKGIYEKSRLTYKFLRNSFQFFSHYRQKTYEILAPYRNEERNTVILWGSGEEAELAYLSIRELGMKLIAIIDPARNGKRCIGFEIHSLTWLYDQENIDILLILRSTHLHEQFENHYQDIQQKCDVKHCLLVDL